jgi:FAD/FMN-containing dehydrogenase
MGAASAPRSEPEPFLGKIIRLVATVLAFPIQVLLSVLILLQQVLRGLVVYPLAVVRVFLPHREHPLPDPLDGDYFENETGNQFAYPAEVRHVSSRSELEKVIRDAEAAGKRVHAIGSGHSFSDVAIADGVLVALRGLDRVAPVETDTLGDCVSPAMLVRAEAGVTIRALNRALFGMGQALVNMGGYDGQTLSGALSTGTHGSGIGLGPLSDMVRSVDLVGEGGKTRRIEPTTGLSSPAKHAAKYGNEIELIQDDDTFHSVVVALGSLGVVCSFVIEVRASYLLAEHREVRAWGELKKNIEQGNIQPLRGQGRKRQLRHFEFLISPYGDGSNNKCLVTYRWEPDGAPKKHAGRSRPFLATLLTSIRELDQIYALALSAFPGLSPFVVGFELTQLVDSLYVGQSYQVLQLGDANYVPAYSSELSFSAEENDPVHGPFQYIRAVDRLIELARREARHGRYHNIPLSVRFVAPSPHLLALSHGRKSAIVEIPLLAAVPGGWDLLRFYERRMFDEFKARAHWGQANFIGADRIFEAYPNAFERWLAVRVRLCPKGTFDNSFTERMGLRALTSHRAAAP